MIQVQKSLANLNLLPFAALAAVAVVVAKAPL